MGIDQRYGDQKNWHAGGTFDGLNKVSNTDFKFGPTADFIFAANSFAGSSYASSTATATASVAKPLSASSAGQATAVVLRKINGAYAPYGFLKHWTNGSTMPGLLKQSFAETRYWSNGNVNADLFPAGLTGRAYGTSTATATASVTRLITGTASGTSVAAILRKIGGARNPNGDQKNWHYGQTFIAFIGTDTIKFDRNKFSNQTLWINGLPTPDILPFEVTVVVNPAKIINTRMQTKRQSRGWPASVKIISARPPSKRSS